MQTHLSKHVPKNIFHRLFKMLDPKDTWKVVLASILMGISVVADLLNPFVMQKVIANMQKDTSYIGDHLDSSKIEWYWFGVMIGLAVVSIGCQIWCMLISMRNATKLSSRLRYRIFSQTRYLPNQDIDKIGSGSILTRVTSDVSQVEQFFINYNTFIIKAIFMSLGAFALSIYQLADYAIVNHGSSDIWYATLSYLFIIFFLLLAGILMKKVLPTTEKARMAVDYNNVMMNENIVGYKTIRSLNLEKIEQRRYKKGNKNLRDLLIKSEKVIAILVPTTFLFLNLAMIAIYTFGGIYSWFADVKDAINTAYIVSVIIAFSQYTIMVLLGLVLFSTFGYTLTRAKVSGKRILQILDTQSSIQEIENPLNISSGEIEFKNVYFSYNQDAKKEQKNKNTYTIKNINFKIKSGQSLGIIGETGSGKSTLVKLLTRLYDVNEGEVLISNKNVKDLSFKSLRDDISVSLQEKVILRGTFKTNILIGNHQASEKEIIEAAKNAEAWEFIKTKEGELNSHVEERGSNLSGGQKQRLSIARALIKKSKILVFDDSTSALDTITESKILNTLKNKYKGVTKIIISQKVRSIQECDNIIVLDKGMISQQGTHNELIKDKNGIYFKIFDSQKTSLEG